MRDIRLELNIEVDGTRVISLLTDPEISRSFLELAGNKSINVGEW